MDPDGEKYAHSPVWMQHALSRRIFDVVVKLDNKLKMEAGDAIGFLGESIVPDGMGKTSSHAYIHIEVISADNRMPMFLDNTGHVTTGRKYIHVHPDSFLYTNSGETFIKTSSHVQDDMHVILPMK